MVETRRLAAIMVVDVVGYSRLMGEDEAGTAQAVREHFEVARPLVAGRGGRTVKTMGDGLLLEFPSVVAAVECAITIQKLMAERNANTPEAKRIAYRIGVNLGDVLIEGDDILGDGVNIAARLEGVCEPGGVLISSSAHEQVRGKVEAEFVDLGDTMLKNIARPVRGFAIKIGAAIPVSSLATRERRGPPPLSMVVLPFVNIGGGDVQEHFVDGVTENLTTELSRIRGALVIARNTAFTYKGKSVDVKAIGNDLDVRYVLEGSVQRSGDRMRVNVQLVDAQYGHHLWAERFDKHVIDLFDMQDEIVSRVARQLDAQLFAAEARRAERSPNPDAMDLCFQGNAWLYKGLDAGYLVKARNYFECALKRDAENVRALLGIATVDTLTATFYPSEDRISLYALAEASVVKALFLAPEYPEAHLTLGIVQTFTNRADLAIAECERALTLNPNLAGARANIGVAKLFTGRGEETESHMQEALRLSPRDTSAFTWIAFVGYSKLFLGMDKEAIDWLRRSIDANQNYPLAHFWLAAALANLGRTDDARSAVKVGLALNPRFTVHRLRVSPTTDDPIYLKQRERVLDGMLKAGIPEG